MLYRYAKRRLNNLDGIYTPSGVEEDLDRGVEEQGLDIGIFRDTHYEFLETSQHPVRVLKKDLKGPERNWAELRNFITRVHGRLGFPANILNNVYYLLNGYRAELIL